MPFDDVDVVFFCFGHGKSEAFLKEHKIPDNVKTGMEIVPVRWIDQVLEEALVRKPEPLKTDSAEKAATAAPIPAAGSNAVSGTQATAH